MVVNPVDLKKIKLYENKKGKKMFANYFRKIANVTVKKRNFFFMKEKDGNKRKITILGFIRFSYKKKNKNNCNASYSSNFIHGKNTILLNNMTIRNPYQNKITIGDNCMINCNFIFESDKGEIEIGDRCFINASTSLISRSKITIGNDVTIAWGCTFYDHNSHSLDWRERANDIELQTKDYLECGDFIKNKNWDVVKSRPITICDKAWIGMNCTILNGVTIGEGAIVGACSVVRDNVEPWTVVAGNPATVIKRLRHE